MFFSVVYQASTGKKLREKDQGKNLGTQRFNAKHSTINDIRDHPFKTSASFSPHVPMVKRSQACFGGNEKNLCSSKSCNIRSVQWTLVIVNAWTVNNLSFVNIFGETGWFFYNLNYMLNSEHLSLVNKIGDKTKFTITRVHCT